MIIIDVMYVNGNKLVIQVVDLTTSYQAACFLKSMSTEYTWEVIRAY
jgi:hypothetical protein